MNQYTVETCPIHGTRMKKIYTWSYKGKAANREEVFETPRCVGCLRDHDNMCEKLDRATVVRL